MFKTRFISGAVLTLLTIGILYLGGYVTGVAVMLLSLGGVFELMRVYKQEKSAMAVLAYLMTIAYYCFLFFHLEKYLLPLMILYVLLVLAVVLGGLWAYCPPFLGHIIHLPQSASGSGAFRWDACCKCAARAFPLV